MSNLNITAVLADVHANSWALEAVLEDIARRTVTRVVNLGDLLYGPLNPAGTRELVRRHPMQHVAGNMDRYIVETSAADTVPTIPLSNPTMRFVVDALGPEAVVWLGQLPSTTIMAPGIFLCHGTPSADNQPLLERITAAGVELKSNAELEAETQQVPGQIILCAHTHVGRHVVLSNGRTIINPGSVGLPAYEDEVPFPHRMQSYSPHAKYCLLTMAGVELLAVEHVSVAYDWHTAAQQAERNGRPDWAASLRSGRA